MKKILVLLIFILEKSFVFAQTSVVEWVETSEKAQWKSQTGLMLTNASGNEDVSLDLSNPQQTILGFGTCFNELGWTSLKFLSASDRESIMRELFAPGVGANFNICRMPVGANDFSTHWYSYDETDGDFEMEHFSIANDLTTLVPFIKNALKYNPTLKLWASPWSPPSWMKYNHHYAARSVLGNSNLQSDEYGIDLRGINNGLDKEKEGKEGSDMFIQEEKYFRAYSLYFLKFLQAYKKENINIDMVMPQNEFNSAQPFPSCTWTAAGLARFISYLGPQLKPQDIDIYFGTMERPNAKLVDTILNDQTINKYIKGVGFQWAGKDAIPLIHQQYPSLILYQSEQECGNGKNDWKNCIHSWELMKHYFKNGVGAYMYWNTSLKQGSISTWGWKQNSLVLVDTSTKTYKYNYEYYLMKQVSHFVKPGAKYLSFSGQFDNLLAFENPDKSIVIVAYNPDEKDRMLRINIGSKSINPLLKGKSFNTWLINK